MKTVATVVAIIAAGLCIAGASVASGDRQTLVPPPDAVAESFARQLIERRYELAGGFLSPSLQQSAGASGLRAWFDSHGRRLGRPNSVEASMEWMQGDRAAARAVVDAQHGTMVLHLRMTRHHGLWMVDELPADLAIGP